MITCATCRAPMNCPEVSELTAGEWAHRHRACRAPSIIPRPAVGMTVLSPGAITYSEPLPPFRLHPEQEWQRRASGVSA